MMEFDSTDNPGRFFFALSRDLKSIALSNIQYFQSGKQSHHAKFHVTFRLLYEYLDIGIEPTYSELAKLVGEYDFSPEIKGNGYRSLLRVVQKCCLHLLQLCRYISSVRDSMLFRKKVYAKELESYVSALGQLRAVLYYALKLTQYCQQGHLFADEDQLNSDIAEALMLEVESLSQEFFYGRCLGFQYCESMQRPVQAIGIVMASLSEGYLESSHMMRVATSVFNSGKYFLDPELRAKQMVKVTRTADIRFCQTFWNFPESPIMHQLPSFVCPVMEVNEILTLGPDAFELPLVGGGDTVTITPPCAHTGPGHVYTRLISAQLREGQQALRKSVKSKAPVPAKPRVPGLIVHFHGGGFVAQSSKSHEVYLRDWAVSVGCPILSVDYSLAPQAPFPRALEECFYAYAWAVQNCEQLGSTGEKIIVVGDSAGGNLAVSTALRAASFGIRAPDGAVLVYPCTVVKYTPSPARLLSLMDPLLPVGLMTRCLAAYAGINEQQPLASPTTDELHSDESLTRIRMETYESHDSEWIIIAQDEDEIDQIRSMAAASQDSPVVERESVIDAMDDSMEGRKHLQEFVGEEDMEPWCNKDLMGAKERSNTQESEEEVEIFSQLLAEGSCVFPSEGEASIPQPDQRQHLHSAGKSAAVVDMVTPVEAVTDGGQFLGTSSSELSNADQDTAASSGSSVKSSGVALLQSRARQMMADAQTMLTSLSSYMPAPPSMGTARSVMSSLAANFDPLNSSTSLHTSKSSLGLTSASDSTSSKPDGANFSPVSGPGLDLPDIETFVELQVFPVSVDVNESEVTRSSGVNGNESISAACPGTAERMQANLESKCPLTMSDGIEGNDLKQVCSNPELVVNGKDADTTRSTKADPREPTETKPSPLTSSSSSGVFETPFSTPVSPSGHDIILPGAESNLSLSSAFLSDTSPHHQDQVLGELSRESAGNDTCQETSLSSTCKDQRHENYLELTRDNFRPRRDKTGESVYESSHHPTLQPSERTSAGESVGSLSCDPLHQPDDCAYDGDGPASGNDPNHQVTLSDHSVALLSVSDPDASSSPSGGVDPPILFATPDKRTEVPAATSDADQHILFATPEERTEVPAATWNSISLSDRGSCLFSPDKTSRLLPGRNDIDAEVLMISKDAVDTPYQPSNLKVTTTNCLQTLDMLSPVTPPAPSTTLSDQQDQSSPSPELSVICELDTNGTSRASQAPPTVISAQNNQASPSPQLPVTCDMDTHSDSPASPASLPGESKELLEDALRSPDVGEVEESGSSSISTQQSCGSYKDLKRWSPENQDQRFGTTLNPQSIDRDMFISCSSEQSDQQEVAVFKQDSNLLTSPSNPQPDTDVMTGQSYQQKRCSPPTSLNIAHHSRSVVPPTATDAQPSPLGSPTSTAQTGVKTSPCSSALPVQANLTQQNSAPTLPVVESSPSAADDPNVQLSEEPVVTLTPTENGGQLRVWPLGVGVKGLKKSGSTPTLLPSVLTPSPVTPQPEKVQDAINRKQKGSESSAPAIPPGLKTGMSPSDFEQQNFSSHSPLHLLRRAAVVKNPYMSPLMASDEMLLGLTRVSIVGCHLDPLLDDSVMFARRLRDLGIPVELNLVDDLPHGFLNFALLSVEARQAADLCGRKISDMLSDSV
ncbi:hypothetical protein RRG08_063525 [Elysia crispata]|uniref:Hormone-sensitive lipase n=1 Tax=Elysia crispata TaxID=231223 RepID=A0AAE1B3Z5_9GAST|nr:hypothetical protein RRG08_063525 [Elysia crispata]